MGGFGGDVFAVDAGVGEVVDDHFDVGVAFYYYVAAFFYYVADSDLHLLNSLRIHAILTIHIPRLEKLTRLLHQIENFLKSRIIVDVEGEGGESLLEVGQCDGGGGARGVSHF